MQHLLQEDQKRHVCFSVLQGSCTQKMVIWFACPGGASLSQFCNKHTSGVHLSFWPPAFAWRMPWPYLQGVYPGNSPLLSPENIFVFKFMKGPLIGQNTEGFSTFALLLRVFCFLIWTVVKQGFRIGIWKLQCSVVFRLASAPSFKNWFHFAGSLYVERVDSLWMLWLACCVDSGLL